VSDAQEPFVSIDFAPIPAKQNYQLQQPFYLHLRPSERREQSRKFGAHVRISKTNISVKAVEAAPSQEEYRLT